MAERGFTLVEVLVALAVFSIAALAIVNLQGASIGTATAVEARTLGGIVAENLAVEALTDPTPPPVGKTGGGAEMGGRAFLWQRSVARLPETDGISRIDLAVTTAEGEPVAALTLYRGI